MPRRIFISFAIEDEALRTLLVGQARNKKSPFEFVDMSVKEPWDAKWKTNCRTRIKGCDGLMALISGSTPKADGQLWEIRCAYEEEVPVMFIWVNDERPALPDQLKGRRIHQWTWENIGAFLDKL